MVQSRGHAIWVVCIVMPIITGVFIGLRLYTRGFITRSLALNDYVAFATMVPIITYSVLLAQATYNGMGQHEGDFTPQQEEGYYFWIMVASEFYVLSLAGFKSALILLYLQLFGVNRKFRWACYIILFYTLGFLLSNLISEVAGCHPIQAFWDPKVKGHCIDFVAADIAYGFGLVSSDLMIAILPLPMIWRLKLVTTRERVGLALVLTSGGVVFIISCARWIVSTIDLVSADRTWVAGAAFLLSVVEVNTGLICGCTPALKPLFITARKASIDYASRRASRKRSFETDKIPTENESIDRTSLEKPLPKLPELAMERMSRNETNDGTEAMNELGSGRLSRHELGSGVSRHELLVEEAARHELEVERYGMQDHDAYDGQNDITQKSSKDASDFV